MTAGRARATTASCKVTQLLYGSSLGLGLWPLDQKPQLPVPTTCVAAPHTRLHDRRIEPCGSDAEAASSRCRTLRHSPRKYTTPPRRVRRAARVSARPHRYRLHCCDIAATAGARHITVAGRRPEGFRCGGFGGHLTAPRTSATPVSACTEVSGWVGGGRASRARHVGRGWRVRWRLS